MKCAQTIFQGLSIVGPRKSSFLDILPATNKVGAVQNLAFGEKSSPSVKISRKVAKLDRKSASEIVERGLSSSTSGVEKFLGSSNSRKTSTLFEAMKPKAKIARKSAKEARKLKKIETIKRKSGTNNKSLKMEGKEDKIVQIDRKN